MNGIHHNNGHLGGSRHGRQATNPFSHVSAGQSDGGPYGSIPPGLLWRTVFRSPCVNWIIPGAIGHPTRTSVAFVGEDHVELKEWDRSHETLFTIAVADDLPAKIIAAQLLGERKTSQNVPDDRKTMNGDDAGLLYSPQVLVLLLANSTLVLLRAEERQG